MTDTTEKPPVAVRPVDHTSPIWYCNYFYPAPREPGEPQYERSSDIRFRDDGGLRGAAHSVLRFLERMQRDWPESYGTIWGFKLYAEDFGLIDDRGYLSPSPSGSGVGASFCAMEIKFDHFPRDWTLRQMVECKLKERFG